MTAPAWIRRRSADLLPRSWVLFTWTAGEDWAEMMRASDSMGVRAFRPHGRRLILEEIRATVEAASGATPVHGFAEMLDADVFICGHQPEPEGFRQANERMLILSSDHSHGVFLPIDLAKPVTMGGLVKRIRKFVSVA